MATIVAAASQTSVQAVTLTGSGAVDLILPIRVRGVFGLKKYTGGTWLGGRVYLGGTPNADNNDKVMLTVSNPAATYYFNYNNGESTVGNVAVESVVDIPVKGNAVLTLTLDNIDSNQYKGDTGDNLITLPGIPLYDGIWAKLDTSFGEPFASYTTELNGGSRGWVFSAYAENAYGIKADR